MKKSICIEKFFREVDFYDRFDCVGELNIEYVEFWYWSTRDIARIKALCQKNNLKIASMSGDKLYSPIINEERKLYLGYLKESLDRAKELGCENLVVHSNGMDENGNITCEGSNNHYEKKIASMTRTFCEAAKLAENAGVTLVFEAVNTFTKPGYFVHQTHVSGDIARVVDSPNFKVLYDIWHMQQMEGNIVRTLTEYIDVLGYIHIGDVPERNEPGTGEINFSRIKRTLDELGYNGIYGLELEPSIPSKESAKWSW